ncbi:MAG: hypothetical protein GY862_08930 [Gammaproteobacteria bacterium]|nr:hypothetical protein [Gammaproteobacteria bacterium]
MSLKSLERFLAENKDENEKKDAIDWSRRKTFWLEAIETFYKQLFFWITPLRKNGLLDWKIIRETRTEPYVGHYEFEKVILSMSGEVVTIEPVGILLIGVFGRIDMKGSRGTTKLVLVPKEFSEPKIEAHVPPLSMDRLTWKIATPPPGIHYFELDDNSFSEALLSIIGG